MTSFTRFVAWALVVVALVYLALCAALWGFQRSLIYFPQPRSAGPQVPSLTLAVPGAQLVVTHRPRPGAPALVYFGGNAEDVSASLPELEAAFAGHALYLLHYRGYGGSTGQPTQDALFADAAALFDHVHAQHPHITVVGRSLGTGVAVHLASQRPVQRLVLVTPYDSILGIASAQFPFFPVRWLLRDPFDSGRYAPAVTAPTLVLMAQHDEVIPEASTRLFYTRFAPGVATLQVADGVGHNAISQHSAYAQWLAGLH